MPAAPTKRNRDNKASALSAGNSPANRYQTRAEAGHTGTMVTGASSSLRSGKPGKSSQKGSAGARKFWRPSPLKVKGTMLLSTKRPKRGRSCKRPVDQSKRPMRKEWGASPKVSVRQVTRDSSLAASRSAGIRAVGTGFGPDRSAKGGVFQGWRWTPISAPCCSRQAARTSRAAASRATG